MFDFNFIIQEIDKAEGFWSFTQNWFDIASLLLALFGLWLAYKLGERGYRRDKEDKDKEQKQLSNSEVRLFKNNLEQLNKTIDKQLKALVKYKDVQNFSLEFHQEVQVDFLKYVNVRHVYEQYGYKDTATLDEINELFAALFALNDFRSSLRDSLRTYITRYRDFEKSFYLYRKLMYRTMHEIANRRAIHLIQENGGVQINFGENYFAREYFHLVQSVLSNPELQDEDGIVIRSQLIDLFIKPAIELSKQYIPANEDAIQVTDMANEVHSAWINMETVTEAHFREIDGHIDTLERVKEQIDIFNQMKQANL